MNVTLLNAPDHALELLYLDYRAATTAQDLADLHAQIQRGEISHAKILAFCLERFATGHRSPFYGLNFKFAVSGISRACLDQLVRHHVGISYEVQSQRVVRPWGKRGPATNQVVPESYSHERTLKFMVLQQQVAEFYEEALAEGVPREDARYALTQAQETQLSITANLGALIHIAEERLCTRAQWEIHHLVAAMQGELARWSPELGKLLAPKCAPGRRKFCDETIEAWQQCPLGGLNGVVRPHASQVEALVQNGAFRTYVLGIAQVG